MRLTICRESVGVTSHKTHPVFPICFVHFLIPTMQPFPKDVRTYEAYLEKERPGVTRRVVAGGMLGAHHPHDAAAIGLFWGFGVFREVGDRETIGGCMHI